MHYRGREMVVQVKRDEAEMVLLDCEESKSLYRGCVECGLTRLVQGRKRRIWHSSQLARLKIGLGADEIHDTSELFQEDKHEDGVGGQTDCLLALIFSIIPMCMNRSERSLSGI